MEDKIEFCDAIKPFNGSKLRSIDWFSLLYQIVYGLTNSKLIIKLSVILIIPMFMFKQINCKPIKPLSNGPLLSSSQSSDHFSLSVEFLMRFGYLPKTDKNNGNLRSDRHLKNAIKAMQSFAHLNPTGILDEPTIKLMKSKRCGVPDFIPSHSGGRAKRYALYGSKWNRTELTWSLSVKNWESGLDYYYVMTQLRNAFKVWSDASKLTFNESLRREVDINIAFLRGRHGDEYPFDGPGSTLGHAFFPGDGIGGDCHFDADENWDQRKYNSIESDDKHWEGVSLFSVAAHEFGHSLGLSHSSVTGSLMFPYYQTIDSNDFKLPYDDLVGIQQLYGSKLGSTTPNRWPIPEMPTPNRPQSRRPSIPKFGADYPNPCNLSSIDAIASIRRNIFIFKSKYFWWLNNDKSIIREQPIEISHYWPDLPRHLSKVDAVYERQTDKKIVFFIGKQYYLFDHSNRLEAGYPKPLTFMGLPDSVERVDAIMIWGHNAKTYIFSGSQYWRFDEQENKVELDYPRDISVWKGIPSPIDAAFQWSNDSQTYFFKDKYFWKFDNRKMSVSDGYPQRLSKFWFVSYNCLIDDSDHFPKIDFNKSPKFLFQIQCYLLSTISLMFYNFYIFNILYKRIEIN